MYPILFEFNYLIVSSYGIFLALALIGSLIALWFYIRFTKQKPSFLQKHFLWLCLAFFIGAKCIHVLFTLNDFSQKMSYYFAGAFHFQTLLQAFQGIFSSGYSITGGLLIAYMYLFFITKKEGTSFHRWADLMVLSALVGLSIGFVGAFLGGNYYGLPSTLPWALTFESSVHSQVRFLSPIHPLQIYAFITCVLFVITLSRIFFYSKTPGFTSSVGIVVLSILFFFFEFIRGDALLLPMLTLNQYVLLAFFVIGVGQLFRVIRKHS